MRRPRIGPLLRSLFQRADPRAEVQEELAFHLRLRVEEHRSRGLDPVEARRRAEHGFGDLGNLTATCCRLAAGRNRRMRLRELLTDLRLDIAFALRQLAGHRGFAIAAILTLGLGIGANGALFSIVNALLLRPLPVAGADRLVVVAGLQETDPDPFRLSYPDFRDLREQSAGLDDLAAVILGVAGIEVAGETDQAMAAFVSHNFFGMLGLDPAHGRLLAGPDDRTGGERALVLGHGYWQRTFGGDPSVVGRSLRVDGQPFTVIGVAPEGFAGTYALVELEVYLPLAIAAERPADAHLLEDRSRRDLRVLGHLAPGTGMAAAQAELDALADRLARAYPATHRGFGLRLFRERDARPEPRLDDPDRWVAGIFLTLVALILLVACLNVANLSLARAARRRGELGIRAALGASRARLVRQALTESAVLAIAGGGAGVAFAVLGSRLLERLEVPGPLRLSFDFGLDWRSLAYLAALALASGLVVGLVPAWRASRGNLEGELRRHARGESGGGRGTGRTLLVACQLAGALVVLIIAGLFARSLAAARAMDLGFRHADILNLTLDPSRLGYDESAGRAFYGRLAERVRAVPGVASAAYAYASPFGYYGEDTPVLAERAVLGEGETPPTVGINAVAPGYFATLGIEVLEGRPFADTDRADGPPVVVVNRTLAEQLWPGTSAVGRRLRLALDGPLLEVVGVVRDTRYRFIFETAEPFLYAPVEQRYRALRVLHVESAGPPPATLAAAVREAVRAVDPAMPIFELAPMTTTLDGGNGFFLPRLGALLTTVMAGLGLALALIGVYGVIALRTAGRRREIGLRVALGARPAKVIRLVLADALVLAAIGLGLGLLMAAAASRTVAAMLYRISASDPPTYLAATLVLAATVLASSLVPALRALRVNPTAALRAD